MGASSQSFEQRSKTRVPALRCSSPLVQTTKVTVSSERSRLLKASPISVTPGSLNGTGACTKSAGSKNRAFVLWASIMLPMAAQLTPIAARVEFAPDYVRNMSWKRRLTIRAAKLIALHSRRLHFRELLGNDNRSHRFPILTFKDQAFPLSCSNHSVQCIRIPLSPPIRSIAALVCFRRPEFGTGHLFAFVARRSSRARG
jgi:hypothetical protein